MSKHTPGPWRIRYKPSGAVYTIDGPNDPSPGAVGCVVRSNGLGMPACEVGHANAHLIAAAPELLAALKEAYEWLRSEGTTADGREIFACMPRVRAAIAKAEGATP